MCFLQVTEQSSDNTWPPSQVAASPKLWRHLQYAVDINKACKQDGKASWVKLRLGVRWTQKGGKWLRKRFSLNPLNCEFATSVISVSSWAFFSASLSSCVWLHGLDSSSNLRKPSYIGCLQDRIKLASPWQTKQCTILGKPVTHMVPTDR